MLSNTQGALASGTLDTAALRGKLTTRMWWTGIRNTVIYALKITKVDGAKATRGRPKSMTLTLHTAEGQESPLMRINPAPRRGPWRNPWPEGIENGVYVAGDLPFGAVGYVPSSGAFFFMQPDGWDATAQDRNSAGPERITRAKDASLARRII